MRTEGLSINLATVRQQWKLPEAMEAVRQARQSLMFDPWRDQVAAVRSRHRGEGDQG